MTAPVVLVTDSSFATLSTERQILADIGAKLELAECRSEDDVIKASVGATALLVQWAPIGRRLFEARPEVRLIVRYGIGLDNVDLVAAAEHGVAVANVPDYCIEEVAEHAVALLLAAHRRVVSFDRLVRAGRWTDAGAVVPPSRPLSEMRIGVVGFGRVGRRTAEMIAGLGPAVRVYDPLVAVAEIDAAEFESAPELADLAGCDAVSLHCPLTDETRGLFDRTFFDLLAPGALIVNTSRGPLIDTEALVSALASGQLAGAGLDTFAEEPLPADHALLAQSNVCATPHVAWLSKASTARLQHEVATEAARFLTGEPLRCHAIPLASSREST